MRKKTKMANICRSLRTKIFFSPVLKSPTHIGFTDVKKNGSKISHLGTFKMAKSAIMTQKIFLLKNINMGIKKTQNFMLISNSLVPA